MTQGLGVLIAPCAPTARVARRRRVTRGPADRSRQDCRWLRSRCTVRCGPRGLDLAGAWASHRRVRMTELRVEGLRTIERASLRLDGLTVLIGENGSGKSSLIEACEILRRAMSERFLDEFHAIHRGLAALLRRGAPKLTIGVTIAVSAEALPDTDADELHRFYSELRYDLSLVPGDGFATLEERITATPVPHEARGTTELGDPITKPRWGAPASELFSRRGGRFTVGGKTEEWEGFDPRAPFLAQVSARLQGDGENMAAQVIASLLRRIQVHLPFEVTPTWAVRALDRKSTLRGMSLLAPATHLENPGLDLATAYHSLKNGFGPEEWRRTLDYVRLGLGERVEDVTTWADSCGGDIGLGIKELGLDRPTPTAQLSDGMLSYLAFVALFRLRVPPPSLVAFDEPDHHLHPRLLMRVLDMFENMAREHPVLVATHSDPLLDGLADPARSAVLCELDDSGRTRLLRPNAEALEKWLERYRGLGDLRASGHERSIFTEPEPRE